MSVIIPLAAGTVLQLGGKSVTLKSAANFDFPVDNLASIAEILAASDRGSKEDPTTSVLNLSKNAAALAHTIVAGGRAGITVSQEEIDALQSFAAGTPVDVTYGANGQRIFTASPGGAPSYYYYY